jgi:drug/metabolite transporter (DMT)-like permease
LVVVGCYLVCAVVWSTTWFAIRVCIGEGGYPTYAAAALRFSIAALILVALLQFKIGRPGPRSARQFVMLLIAGLFNAVCYGCIYRAEESLPGGLVAVLFGTYPLFTALGAHVTGVERVRPVDLAAAVLSLGGMAILFWDRISISPEQATGVVYTLGSVLACVAYNLVFKREADGVSPLSSTTVFLGGAALGLWVPAIAAGHDPIPLPPPLWPTVALFYLAMFGSVLAFVCYFELIRRVSLMTASTLVLVQPVIALAVDAVWEDEVRLAARSYVGAAVILAGVAVGLTWKWRTVRQTVSDRP